MARTIGRRIPQRWLEQFSNKMWHEREPSTSLWDGRVDEPPLARSYVFVFSAPQLKLNRCLPARTVRLRLPLWAPSEGFLFLAAVAGPPAFQHPRLFFLRRHAEKRSLNSTLMNTMLLLLFSNVFITFAFAFRSPRTGRMIGRRHQEQCSRWERPPIDLRRASRIDADAARRPTSHPASVPTARGAQGRPPTRPSRMRGRHPPEGTRLQRSGRRKTHPVRAFLGKFWGLSAWMLETIMVCQLSPEYPDSLW